MVDQSSAHSENAQGHDLARGAAALAIVYEGAEARAAHSADMEGEMLVRHMDESGLHTVDELFGSVSSLLENTECMELLAEYFQTADTRVAVEAPLDDKVQDRP
ncbi:MAG: hypothetical protein ACKPKO_09535, partial [Candidatus Fonsibacter sp.]